MRLPVIAAIVVLSGCATASKVPLDNGRQGFAIECPKMAQCYKKAAKLCAPNHYETVGSSQRTSGGFVGGVGAIGQTQGMTVICKAAE